MLAARSRHVGVDDLGGGGGGGVGGGGGKVWLGLPDAQRAFMHMQGTNRCMHRSLQDILRNSC